jgi:hypothetical protein
MQARGLARTPPQLLELGVIVDLETLWRDGRVLGV